MPEPRTPRQFADAGMVIKVACRCGHEQALDPLMVEFTHGENFDLAADWRELVATLSCEACGSPPPIISFEADNGTEPEVAAVMRRALGGRRS